MVLPTSECGVSYQRQELPASVSESLAATPHKRQVEHTQNSHEITISDPR
ncbi:hypothetical protein RB2083_1735 [Rhodobacteraceae bacterium HTCC2083]|nr:hypothetical protein RB2083_1735 [Rhodobacteraceae bacterium HTCC2083]